MTKACSIVFITAFRSGTRRNLNPADGSEHNFPHADIMGFMDNYRQVEDDSIGKPWHLLTMPSPISKGNCMKPSVAKIFMALGLGAVGVAIAAAGIYIGDTDDAPRAALIGILIMISALVFGVKIAWRKN